MHARIIPVIVRFMLCSNFVIWSIGPNCWFLDKQSVRLLQTRCEERRTVIYFTNFQQQWGELSPGRLDSLPQHGEPREMVMEVRSVRGAPCMLGFQAYSSYGIWSGRKGQGIWSGVFVFLHLGGVRLEVVNVSTPLPTAVEPRWGRHLALVLQVGSVVESWQRRWGLQIISLRRMVGCQSGEVCLSVFSRSTCCAYYL